MNKEEYSKIIDMGKYRLIHVSKQNTEHLCDKVTIDGFDYYVSNEKPEPCNPANICMAHKTKRCDKCGKYQGKKVIATNNPNIDIPKVVDIVEMLGENETNIRILRHKTPSQIARQYFDGFIKGYNKSKEIHSNSDEDMIAFSEWISKNSYKLCANGEWILIGTGEYPVIANSTQELFQLWEEQQTKIVYYE